MPSPAYARPDTEPPVRYDGVMSRVWVRDATDDDVSLLVDFIVAEANKSEDKKTELKTERFIEHGIIL